MSSSNSHAEREQLEKAIAAQESLRGTVDDAIIDATIATLQEKLAGLESTPFEQRKLATILFMDIAGHTALVKDLDPEEQMAIVDPIISRLAGKVDQFGGHVARYQGDGFKAVFGLPVAHENDPQQAVRAGLAIQKEADKIAHELEDQRGLSGFKVRVGITTGLIFAGGETEGEDTIKGSPVNLAARIESAAEPGTVLISHDCFLHVRGIFDIKPQQPIEAKGFLNLVNVYRVKGEKTQGFYQGMRGVEGVETRMIGREPEFVMLQKALEDVIEEKERQLTTIVGEAGIGKSRLLFEFETWMGTRPEEVTSFKGRALLEIRSQPYGLWRDMFAYHFDIHDDDSGAVARKKFIDGFGLNSEEKHKTEAQAHVMGQLLGFNFRDSPHLSNILADPMKLRERAFSSLVHYFKTLSRKRPIVVFVEDLHWADDASLETLIHLAMNLEGQQILILTTTRPNLFERRPNWGEGQDFFRNIYLNPLSKRDCRRLVGEVLQKVENLPLSIQELLIESAEGNPFYVEELVKLLVENRIIHPGENNWSIELTGLEEIQVPSTLTGVLQARLDGLPLDERKALQGASVIGRVFWDRALEYIQASWKETVAKKSITELLDDLRKKELIYRRETTAISDAREHIFKHAVLREVTYESVLKNVRKSYHSAVADWLIEHTGDRVSEFFALISDHLEHAGRKMEAIKYLQKAGEEARAIWANEEAITFFNRAHDLLSKQPQTTKRDEQELDILIKLGPVLIRTRGFNISEYEQTYSRAAELAERTGQVNKLFFATWNLQKYRQQVGDNEKAKNLKEQLFHVANLSGDERLLLEAHHSAWTMETSSGNFIAAIEHIKNGLEIYEPDLHKENIQIHGHDPGVCALGNRAMNLWMLGFPDQAKQSALEGLALAKQFAHPFTLALGWWGTTWTAYLRGDFDQAIANIQQWMEIIKKYEFSFFISSATLLWGASLVRAGKKEEGLGKIREVQVMNETVFNDPHDRKTLSEYLAACHVCGEVQEGLALAERSLEMLPITGQRAFEQEIRRLYGELMLADDPNRTEEAEGEFHLAIEISKKQKAVSLELRAVMSLARLWLKQGKAQQAHQRLAEVYDWFTEGFDTADLLEAKALLDELIN